MADNSQDVGTSEVDACTADALDNYSVGLHVAAIFIMCASGKAFGTGVVIATGFIHMLMEAAELLGNECAPAVFHDYEPFPYVICIGTIFFVQALEFFLTRALLPSPQDCDLGDPLVTALAVASNGNEGQIVTTDAASMDNNPPGKPLEHDLRFNQSTGYAETKAIIGQESSSVVLYPEVQQSSSDSSEENIQQTLDGTSVPEKDTRTPTEVTHQHGHVASGHIHGHMHVHHHDQIRLRKRVAVMVLEVGIAFHSIIIGLTLGVQPDGDSFNTLLIALCFHQFFEGWALAEVIRDAQFVSFKIVLLTGMLYALTTPLGVTIGVAIHDTYNANSPTSITLLGVLDCISAGILIYMGLVQFMTSWFTANEEFMRRSLWWILCVYFALAGGMAVMSIIGIWS